MRAVKFSFLLFVLIAATVILSGCNTLADRRSLYAPKKGDGYWTKTLQDGTWHDRGTKSADQSVTHGESAPAAPAAPIPPPPAPPLPDAS